MKEKINKVKDILKRIIDNNYLFTIICIILIVCSAMLRYSFIYHESWDYTAFLSNWWNEIYQNGLRSFGMNIGDYTNFYLVLLFIGTFITTNSLIYIKMATFFFEILFVLTMYVILRRLVHKPRKISAVIAIASSFIPTLIFNGAVASQCDVIYTLMIIIMIYFTFREKYKTALLFFGLAFAIKLQSIFVAPIILYLLVHKKIKIYDLMIIGIPYIAFAIPSIIAGKSMWDIIAVYINQTNNYTYWTLNAPNFYQILKLNFVEASGLIYLPILLVGISIIALIYLFRKQYSKELILKLCVFFAILVPYFLPKMHERYFFVADMLAFIYVLIDGRKKIKLFLLVVIASFFSYASFLWDMYAELFPPIVLRVFNLQTVAVFNFIALLLIANDLRIEYKNKKEKNIEQIIIN